MLTTSNEWYIQELNIFHCSSRWQSHRVPLCFLLHSKDQAGLQFFSFWNWEYPSNMLIILARSFPFGFDYLAIDGKIWANWNSLKQHKIESQKTYWERDCSAKVFDFQDWKAPAGPWTTVCNVQMISSRFQREGGTWISWNGSTKCWGRSGKSTRLRNLFYWRPSHSNSLLKIHCRTSISSYHHWFVITKKNKITHSSGQAISNHQCRKV